MLNSVAPNYFRSADRSAQLIKTLSTDVFESILKVICFHFFCQSKSSNPSMKILSFKNWRDQIC